MSSKKGGKKTTKVMNLTDFTGDKKAGDTQQDSLAWAEDDWEDEQEQEQALQAANAAKLFGRKAGAMDDFRSAAVEQLATIVPEDMVAPFVAHVGNLPNTITEQQLEEEFANQFNVLQVGVVKRPKVTFGYVEVETRDELQALILQAGRNILGRKIRADVASEQQIERFKGTGQGNAFSALSRDAIGSQDQPDFRNGGGMGRGGMRQSGSMGDLDRDTMGAQEQPGMRGGGFGGFGGSAEDLDFRSQGPMAQPPAPGMGGGRDGRNFRGSQGGSKPASPNVQQAPAEPSDFGGWRDAPVQAQPTVSEKSPRKDEKKGAWGGRKGGKESASPVTKNEPETEGGAGWRRDAPKESEQKEEKKEKPAWGPKKTIQPKPTAKVEPAGNDNRFGALRK